MTAEERMRRALAVENMHRLYKKYYPVWVEHKKQEATASGTYTEVDEKSASIFIFPLPLFRFLRYNGINT